MLFKEIIFNYPFEDEREREKEHSFIGLMVQRLYQQMYFSMAERYSVCTAASYLC
jgi:hypothetical protein